MGLGRSALAGMLLSLIVLMPQASSGQVLLDSYSIESWDERHGLSPGRIWAITQDAGGYLWLGTESGLVRFDGVRFVRWMPADGSELPDDLSIFSLHAARDGSLWVGLNSGAFGRIRNGQLERYSKPPGFDGTPIQFFAEDRRGTMWAGDPGGIYQFRNGRWEPVGESAGLPRGGASDVYEDRAGNLWIGTNSGVFVRHSGATTFEPADGHDAGLRLKFSEDSRGQLWFTDPQDGFKRLGGLSTNTSQPIFGLDLAHDRDDTLWIGTRGQGLWLVPPTSGSQSAAVKRITVTEGLSSNIVRSVFGDRDGNMWVGTESGLHRFTARKVTPVFDVATAAAVEATPDGSVWMATSDGLVRFVKGSQHGRYGIEEGLPNRAVRALFTDARGTLWVATENGVARRVGNRFEPLPLADPQLPPRVISIAADLRGHVWISARERGAFAWSDGHFVPLVTRSGLSGAGADFVYVDRRDRLWIGLSDARVAVIDQDGTETVHLLGDDIGALLSAVYEDRDGAIWIGGTRGLARISGNRLDVVHQPSALPAYGVFAITQDDEGFLWLGVSSGLIRLQTRDFETAARDPRARFTYQFFDSSEGLVGVPARLAFPGAVRNADGTLWFITSRGASIIRPRQMVNRGAVPPLRIERVTADDRPIAPGASMPLPPGTSRLLFEYTSVNLTSPMTERFQYRLDGVDAGWVSAGTRREAFYSNLRSGTYRFHVARLTGDASAAASAATFEFSIRPHYYETWWFMLGCLTAAALLAWTAWQLRLRQLRRQFALVFAERARMSRELHDTLLQDLVGVTLHFNDVAESLEHTDPPAAGQIMRLRRYLERSIREARQAVWDLRNGITTEGADMPTVLRDAGERLFRGRPTRFEMVVEGEVRRCAPEVEQHLLRIAREALCNAAWHADASSVHLTLEYRHDMIVLQVRDDGRGCDARECSGDLPGHHGFLIMRERAAQAGGALRVDTSHGAGTRIEVTIPARRAA